MTQKVCQNAYPYTKCGTCHQNMPMKSKFLYTMWYIPSQNFPWGINKKLQYPGMLVDHENATSSINSLDSLGLVWTKKKSKLD